MYVPHMLLYNEDCTIWISDKAATMGPQIARMKSTDRYICVWYLAFALAYVTRLEQCISHVKDLEAQEGRELPDSKPEIRRPRSSRPIRRSPLEHLAYIPYITLPISCLAPLCLDRRRTHLISLAVTGIASIDLCFGTQTPTYLFSQPALAEVARAGFDRPTNAGYPTFQIPRVVRSKGR